MELWGIDLGQFGRCRNLTATASGYADFFVEVIAFACLLQTPRYGNWGKYWEAVIVMRCIHTRNCDAQLTEFNSDVYRQGNV